MQCLWRTSRLRRTACGGQRCSGETPHLRQSTRTFACSSERDDWNDLFKCNAALRLLPSASVLDDDDDDDDDVDDDGGVVSVVRAWENSLGDIYCDSMSLDADNPFHSKFLSCTSWGRIAGIRGKQMLIEVVLKAFQDVKQNTKKLINRYERLSVTS